MSSATTAERRAGLFLLALVAGGGLLRFYRLGSNSLWIDEFATLQISSLPFSEIFRANLSNNSFEPPLYFWLIHGIVRVLGSSETAIRLPSAIAGSLTIPVVWLLAREMTANLNTAHLTATLLTFNPLHLWYSQEARPYAMLVLAACLATVFLARALRSSSRGAWLGFTGFTALAVFIHLVGLVLLLVAWVWGIVDAKRQQLVRPLLGSSAVVLACAGPLAISIALASARIPGTGSPPRPPTGLEIPYTVLSYVTGYSFGPSLRDIQNLGPTAALAAHPIESALAIVAVAGLLILITRHHQACLTGFTVLFASYVGVIFLASVITGKAYSIRYTLPGLIGFLGLIAVALRSSRAPLGRALPALLLILFAWADAQWFFSPSYWKDDSRAAVRWLSGHLPPGSKVAVAPDYAIRILTHYAGEQSAEFQIVPAIPNERWTNDAPVALVLTRLHHVPDHANLVATFRRMAGGSLLNHRGLGYDVYVRQSAQR